MNWEDWNKISEATLQNRANAIAESLMSDLNMRLYGDDVPWSGRSVWYKFKFMAARYGGRVRDAWLVLTGRADVE